MTSGRYRAGNRFRNVIVSTTAHLGLFQMQKKQYEIPISGSFLSVVLKSIYVLLVVYVKVLSCPGHHILRATGFALMILDLLYRVSAERLWQQDRLVKSRA